MNATEMVEVLITNGHLSAPRKKDVITSLRKLSHAAEIALADLYLDRLQSTYEEILKTYFTTLVPAASIHTQRNTFQNIAQLYRSAYAAGLLRITSKAKAKRMLSREARQEMARLSPYHWRFNLPPYTYAKDEWPINIVQHWEAYRAERGFDLRDETFKIYEHRLSTYVSYSLRFEHPPITTWDQLFEMTRLRRFIEWHCTRLDLARDAEQGHRGPKTRITQTGADAVHLMVNLARYYKRPEAKDLIDFRRKLPAITPMHNKADSIHTVTARELEDLGLMLLSDARQPLSRALNGALHPGARRAIACQNGLMIRLWWRVPIRSRSMREMDISLPGVANQQPRLYQDDNKIWHLRYQGEQLKIGERRGRTNEFRVPFPPPLVPHLEEYLSVFRPLIPNANRDPHLFLAESGRPLTKDEIWSRLIRTTYRFLGRRIYPHILRTLWTDMYLLSSGGDIDTAAYMLNDKPATVLKHYHELRADQQVAKAYAFNEAVLDNGHGHANGKGKTR